jgi:glycosyltransferase involved in cell wall biosynthesis
MRDHEEREPVHRAGHADPRLLFAPVAAPTLSVVMPVYNEAKHLSATVEALVQSLAPSGFEAELVLVDDGSSDGSGDTVRAALDGRLPLVVVEQPNQGRFKARRAGIEAASGEWVLLLDGRCRLDHGALAFVRERLGPDARIWNAHVYVDTRGNPYGAFWNALAEIAWREYFDNPRTTSFDSTNFDHYPKGTTCFLAPRKLLLDATAAFRSAYSNMRFVSDDTGLIRRLAERESIHVSPGFSCLYAPRTNLQAFLRQALYRGSTFVDGHARRESRFFPVAIAFYPVSVLLARLAWRRPALVPPLAIGVGLAAGSVAKAAGRSRFEIASFAVLVPPYAVFHGLGMWRGLGMILARRVFGGDDGDTDRL